MTYQDVIILNYSVHWFKLYLLQSKILATAYYCPTIIKINGQTIIKKFINYFMFKILNILFNMVNSISRLKVLIFIFINIKNNQLILKIIELF